MCYLIIYSQKMLSCLFSSIDYIYKNARFNNVGFEEFLFLTEMFRYKNWTIIRSG